MAKKLPKKRTKGVTTHHRNPAWFYIHVTIFTAFVLLIAGVVLFAVHQPFRQRVLGASTFLLAKGGDDSGEGSNDSGGSSGNGSSGSSGSTGSNDIHVSGEGSSSVPIQPPIDRSGDSKPPVRNSEPPRPSRIEPTRKPEDKSVIEKAHEEVQREILERELLHRESEMETHTSSLEAGLEAETKDNKRKIDLTADGVRTRLEIRDHKVVVKVQHEDGTESELADDTLGKIDEHLGRDDVHIATNEAAQFIIQRHAIAARTNFPLSVDAKNKTLTVETPSGQSPVVALPDDAIANALGAKVISRVTDDNGTSMSLEEEKGSLVYKLHGVSDQKFLALFPVSISKDVNVSAQTGGVISTDESFGQKILDFFSF